MRNVKLDHDNPLDLHEQVAGEIRRAIADGEAKPGERLPPAKDLAANWWIVGGYLVVIDNGDTAPAQMYWGFFVNPDKDHVVSTGRCFSGGLAPNVLPLIENGHLNLTGAAI